MEPLKPALSPDEAERQILAMIETDGLPMFVRSAHDRTANILEITWSHGLTFCFDLDVGEIEPFDELDHEAIRGEGPGCGCSPIDITVPGSPADPREPPAIPGVRIHHVPELHPDDVTEVHGIPCTTVSRTLIDLAEELGEEELREAFRRARDLDLLDPEALVASRERVEWRPSLTKLDVVMSEFCD